MGLRELVAEALARPAPPRGVERQPRALSTRRPAGLVHRRGLSGRFTAPGAGGGIARGQQPATARGAAPARACAGDARCGSAVTIWSPPPMPSPSSRPGSPCRSCCSSRQRDGPPAPSTALRTASPSAEPRRTSLGSPGTGAGSSTGGCGRSSSLAGPPTTALRASLVTVGSSGTQSCYFSAARGLPALRLRSSVTGS
jgi:hypothetical protein